MDEELTQLVWHRARHRREYCRLHQDFSLVPFEIDHIIARKHGGPTAPANRALSCFYCNNAKGPNIAGIDARDGRIVRLFHPRRHKWGAHFRWDGARLIGRTPLGRATVAVLNINEPDAVATRAALIAAGLFPPV
jgi:HNH endonuclease